jgi:predicted MPP superfamily phosphohydrolase
MEVLAPEVQSDPAKRPAASSDAPCPEVSRPDTRPADAPAPLSRRIFLGAAGAAAAGMLLYAGEISRHELVTEQRSIAIEHLPESFDGFRIAQISDFHYAAYTEPFYIERVVERVNALRPDLVLLTGDFVSMSPIEKSKAQDYAPLCAAILGRLECPLLYGVLGNHDWMVNGAAVTSSLRAVNIHILDNQYLPLEREGQRIWLAGVADALSQDVNIPRAIPPHALIDREPVLFMCHEPDMLDVVARYGVDLMLSGHTHGGQVRLPFMPPYFLPPLGQRYVAGHFVRRRTQLYVNRGIGAVGLPFRFNCPSEITEITLRPA